jgi:hypothetical protein
LIVAYKAAKLNNYVYTKRISYLYIYKCRKYLYKKNKINIKKLNKTKEKLFRFYEESNINDLDSIELYNYYKLYKIDSVENIQNKLINILKCGKEKKLFYDFQSLVYKEKCKIALEKEYSLISQQNNVLLNNENNSNKINVYFIINETNDNYKLVVDKNFNFMKVIHILFNKFPELESYKIGKYTCNGMKVGLFDTLFENGIIDGSIISIDNHNN